VINYLTGILTNVAVFGVIALGLDVQWGWAGLVNLSYVTFVAAGAYAYAVTTSAPAPANGSGGTYILGLQWPFLGGVAAGMVVAAILAAGIGFVALKRLRPEYFAIVTLSVGLVIFQLVSQIYGLFNGQEGMYAIPNPVSRVTWGGTSVFPESFLLICAAFLALALGFAKYVHDSPFGRAVRATRDDEETAADVRLRHASCALCVGRRCCS
jgi:ABC-type branched-subunit amino acid transport system permease subunit